MPLNWYQRNCLQWKDEPAVVEQAADREAICYRCEHWDKELSGCDLLRRCERHALTRALWKAKFGHCRIGKWGEATKNKGAKESASSYKATEITPLQNEMVQEYMRRLSLDYTPPTNLSGDGIVYVGDDRYWPGVVVAIKLIRELGCKLPIQAWHAGIIGNELDGYDVTTVDAHAVASAQKPLRYLHFQAKTFAIINSGFERVLYLDADAYPVVKADVLFALLQKEYFAYWSSGYWSENLTNKRMFSFVNHWIPPIQGGHYLVDCRNFWKELSIARFMDDYAEVWGNRNWDEDSWRCPLSTLKSNFNCTSVVRGNRAGVTCHLNGEICIVHRIHSKLFPNAVPFRNRNLPMEDRVFELYQEMFPDYMSRLHWKVSLANDMRNPERLRNQRHAQVF